MSDQETAQSPETPEEQKKQDFLANPNNYEKLQDVLISCKKSPEESILVLNNCQTLNDCWLALGAIQTQINFRIIEIMQKQRATQLIKPGNNGFKSGLRNFLGKN